MYRLQVLMVLENCSSTNTADLHMETSLQELAIMPRKFGVLKHLLLQSLKV